MRAVYSDKMAAPAQGGSPSAAKPAMVIEAWLERWPNLVVRPPAPVTRDDFYRAHARRYVDDVLTMALPNGFGTCSEQVNSSLFYTSGAMLTAARWALAAGGAVAAPVSGFHHVCWDHGGGFCTFNGLMVTLLTLQTDAPDLRVGILDYDYHYGNGTDDIIARLAVNDVVHITAGVRWQDEEQAQEFLSSIPDDIDALRSCDLVLYQAGADAHIADPLGGFLTSQQLAARDSAVFGGLAALRIPVAWNLAGGYQRPLKGVVSIHVSSMAAVEEVEALAALPQFAG